MGARPTGLGILAVAWGALGLLGSLLEALYRLTPLALEPLLTGMRPLHWGLYVGFVCVNAYAEGYRGFQLRFAPRVAARAQLLAREPEWPRVLLAPLFIMALVEATRRRLWANWLLLATIVLLVLGVRALPQPWRGIVDAGVVAGLTWGTCAVLWELGRVWRGANPRVDPELPNDRRAVTAGAATRRVVSRGG